MTNVRVLTYNVNFGSFLTDQFGRWNTPPPQARRVLQAITDSDADVVCLQETNEGWEQFLRPPLAALGYTEQAWLHPSTGYYAAGSATLIRATPRLDSAGNGHSCHLLHSDEVPTSESVTGCFFNSQVASLQVTKWADGNSTTTNQTVRFANAHLRPPLAMGNDGEGILANANAYLFTSSNVHKREVQALIAHCEQLDGDGESAPVVVLGDFNEGSWGGAVSWLMKTCGYKDALQNLQAGGSTTTWRWPLKWGLQLTGSYDHILVKPSQAIQLVPQSGKIWQDFTDASDHVPVHCEVQLFHKQPPNRQPTSIRFSKPCTS
eukprot:TRINITY_DN79096_c0_g1_i1.p1 TRINITY_DN79096_c0_g1~~TRINITY_DN79096_c0_g1_i1.p1  ORF type:complete len:320 (-),score=26.41 TRINITY_DN79096_c0_g1_i1:79-1038(-)